MRGSAGQTDGAMWSVAYVWRAAVLCPVPGLINLIIPSPHLRFTCDVTCSVCFFNLFIARFFFNALFRINHCETGIITSQDFGKQNALAMISRNCLTLLFFLKYLTLLRYFPYSFQHFHPADWDTCRYPVLKRRPLAC